MPIIAVLFSVFFTLAMSNEPAYEYYDAIRQSVAMDKMRNDGCEIISINHSLTLKCPGCYQFEVFFKNQNSDKIIKTTFYTRDTKFGENNILVFKKEDKPRF